MKPEKTQHEKDLSEYYQNRSKYTKIKPYANGWKVWGSTVVPTLEDALKTRGKI